jgi:hypothetical protein
MPRILLALFVVAIAASACSDNRRGNAVEVRPGQLPPGAPGTTPLLEPQAGPQQRR